MANISPLIEFALEECRVIQVAGGVSAAADDVVCVCARARSHNRCLIKRCGAVLRRRFIAGRNKIVRADGAEISGKRRRVSPTISASLSGCDFAFFSPAAYRSCAIGRGPRVIRTVVRGGVKLKIIIITFERGSRTFNRCRNDRFSASPATNEPGHVTAVERASPPIKERRKTGIFRLVISRSAHKN